MRVGADNHAARHAQLVDHDVVTDAVALHAMLALDLVEQLHAMSNRKPLLRVLQLERMIVQLELTMTRGQRLLQQSQVVAKQHQAIRVRHARVFTEAGAKQRVGHRGHVVVRKAQVGAHEVRLPGRDARHTDLAVGAHDVACDQLFDQRHRSPTRRHRGALDFADQALRVVGKQATGFDDIASEPVDATQKLGQLHAPALQQARQKVEVGRHEDAEVLAILQEDLLDAATDDQPNPGFAQRERRGLARRAVAKALARYQHLKATSRDLARFDDASGQPDQAVARERCIEVVASPRGRDFVGRNPIAQWSSRRKLDRAPATHELRPEHLWALAQHQHAPRQGKTAAQPAASTTDIPEEYAGSRAFAASE